MRGSRRGQGPGGSGDPSHAPGNAHPVLRRRDRDDRRAGPPRSPPRSGGDPPVARGPGAGPLPHPDAVDALRRIHSSRRGAVAPGRRSRHQRGRSTRGPRFGAPPLPRPPGAPAGPAGPGPRRVPPDRGPGGRVGLEARGLDRGRRQRVRGSGQGRGRGRGAAGDAPRARRPSGGAEPGALGGRGGRGLTRLDLPGAAGVEYVRQEGRMAEIVLEDVSKIYGDGTKAISDLDLDIKDGEFMVLVGPSGCGKTTALRMVAGLENISEGTVRIGDRVVNTVPPKERDIAMVFQNYALYPHMTVYDNMGFGLKLRKLPKGEIDRRVREAAAILGLEEFLDKKPGALSGGQRQRVAMGRAIVREPKAFLMDEPLSNLDAKLRVEMRAAVSRLQQRLETTTVYVTHDQTEAMTLGDRVAVMRAGILQQVDAPRALYDDPRNIFVAGFIGSPAMNFFTGAIEGDQIRAPMGSIPLSDQLRRALDQHGTGRRD